MSSELTLYAIDEHLRLLFDSLEQALVDLPEVEDHAQLIADIERDIERTRSQMAGTLDDIQRRFSPGQMVDQPKHERAS